MTLINKYSQFFNRLQQLFKGFCIIILFQLYACDIIAQPIPVGDLQEDHYRILQLLSDSTAQSSFSNRPVWSHDYRKFEDLNTSPNSLWSQPFETRTITLTGGFSAGIYNPIITNTYNSKLPYGGNNSAAWYGKGLNTEFKAGGWITSDYFTITFLPHVSFQQNKNFPTPRFIPETSEGNPLYRSIINGIDMPFRFGPDSYTTFDLGQSSVRLHYKQLEAGFSKENLWWGPGVQNALIMSNNAPGVKHVFLGTRSPLPLPLNIGNIEFRLIGGWPKDSKYFPEDADTNRQRFMSGTNLIFSPSFLPGLHLGFTRVAHLYIPDEGLTFDDYISSINFGDRQTTGDDGQNQLVSVYFRWVFPESSAEIYGEYFREDSFFDTRDLFMEPDHDRAYTIGAQKILKSQWINFFKVNVELNNLVPNRVDEVRPQTYYYRHSQIRQGHTNNGQVLGAAIGPGSGSQYLGVEGYFDRGMLGMFIQRVEDNDFFYFEFYDNPTLSTAYKDIWRNRINLNIGLKGHYRKGNLLLSGKLIWNNNLNYGRFNYGDLDINFGTYDPHDVVNIQLQATVRYLFK